MVVGLAVGGFRSDWAGLALIGIGAAWLIGSRVRLVGRYLPRVRLTWVPAESGLLRRRRPENLEERALRLARKAAELEPADVVPGASTDDERSSKPRVTPAAQAEMPSPQGASTPPAAVQELLAEGQKLMADILAARRQRTTNPLGINPAVNRVAGSVQAWNERVAEVVDGSRLPFQTKMTLAVYQDPPLGIIGASAERVAHVIENNLSLLRQVRGG